MELVQQVSLHRLQNSYEPLVEEKEPMCSGKPPNTHWSNRPGLDLKWKDVHGGHDDKNNHPRPLSAVVESKDYNTNTEGYPRSLASFIKLVTHIQEFDQVVRNANGSSMRTILSLVHPPVCTNRDAQASWDIMITEPETPPPPLPVELISLERFMLGRLYVTKMHPVDILPPVVLSALTESCTSDIELEVRVGTLTDRGRGEWAGIYETNHPSMTQAMEILGSILDNPDAIDTCKAHGIRIYTQVMTTVSHPPTDIGKPTIRQRCIWSRDDWISAQTPLDETVRYSTERIVKHRCTLVGADNAHLQIMEWMPDVAVSNIRQPSTTRSILDVKSGGMALRASVALEIHTPLHEDYSSKSNKSSSSSSNHNGSSNSQSSNITRTGQRFVIEFPIISNQTISLHVTMDRDTGGLVVEIEWNMRNTDDVDMMVLVPIMRELMYSLYWLQLWLQIFQRDGSGGGVRGRGPPCPLVQDHVT